MKTYDSIKSWRNGHFGKRCLAFDKPDGSNMRFEWSRKKCKLGDSTNDWYKFGTRTQMIDVFHPHFGNVVNIFHEKYSEDLSRIFFDRKEYRNVQSFVVFAEYLGENSICGQHSDADEDMDIILFDVSQYKRGIINPFEFEENFGHLHIPEVIFRGNYSKEFVLDILEGKYNVDEGVVIKEFEKEKVWMCKAKTKAWIEKATLRLAGNLHLISDDLEAINI